METILSFIVGENRVKKFDDCEEVVVEYVGDENSSVSEVKEDYEEIPVIDFSDQTLQQIFDTEYEAHILQQLKDMVQEIHCEWPFEDNLTNFDHLQSEVRRLKAENAALQKRVTELEAKCNAFNPNRGDKI